VQVVVSIPPQKWLAEQLGQEAVQVRVLLDRGQDPHGFQPTPEQATALFRAQVYFAIGLEFERGLIRKVTQGKTGLRLLDTSKDIQKIPMVGHHHPHNHHHHHHDDGLDPHVWLAPKHLQTLATVMAKELSALDPDNSTRYQENLDKLLAELVHLDEGIQSLLAPHEGKTFMVFHPAFGYFAEAYKLHQDSLEVEGKAPTPKQLYALTRRAKEQQVQVIFIQPQFDQRSTQTLADALGAKVAVLDPLAEDVPATLWDMAQQIHAALTP
jgi:zinc transport system substrate-binding protein